VSSPASRFSPADVEAARRELAKRHVSDFACMVDIPTVPLTEADDEDRFSVMKLGSLAAHHKLILDGLQGVENGTIPNLMLLLPPGSAKSTYADVVFVPWFMARKSRRNVILASYASDIAKKQGRRARQLIKSKSFENLMGVTLKGDQSAADEWALSNGSEYMAGGLLSGLTGNRAALGILDDPIRGREAAESQTIRDKTWDAYTDDFCSRLIPGAPQVMILTRWHQDDPAGRILPEDWAGESGRFEGRDGRIWHVICLPAIADRADDPLGRKIGDTLWPEWFSLDHWRPFQKNIRTWTSLYQQKPSAPEGTFFQREWFRRYENHERPANLKYYMTSDHAPGASSASDWNVFRVWGIDEHQRIWEVDGHRSQSLLEAVGIEIDDVTGEQTVSGRGALALIRKWKPFCWFPENDNNWKSAEPFIKAAMKKHKIRCRIEALSTAGGDKATKAQAFQSKATMGEVYIRAGHAGDMIIEEYVGFPGAKHDDEVDAAANIGRALDMAHPALVPSTDLAPKAVDRYARLRERATAGDDNGMY
jgi:hypothetical protein